MALYDDHARAMADELRTSGQGALKYVAPPALTGPAWNPTPGTQVEYDVDGVVTGVSARYVDGTSILATDQSALIVAFGVTPTPSGTFKKDGTVHQIIRVDQIPAAGTPVAWRIFLRK